jgi:hypothetical protein
VGLPKTHREAVSQAAEVARPARGEQLQRNSARIFPAEETPISGGGNADDVRQNFLLLINNAGKTPGEITAMEFGFCDAADMPPEPIYTTFPSVAWIAPDTHHLQFTTIEIQSMRPGVSIPPGDINVYGRIRYRDVFRRPYHFCFCVTVRPDGRTFVTPNPPRAYIGWQ